MRSVTKWKLQWITLILFLAFMALGISALTMPEPAPDVKVTLVKNEVSLPDVVEQVLNSTVHIECPQGGWQGSGFVVAPGVIGTARHVAEDQTEFELTFGCGRKAKAYKAISSKRYDIAFILLEGSYPPVLPLGSVDSLRLGDKVFAIGGSLGKRHYPNLTLGVVSNLNLDLEEYGCPEKMGWSTMWMTDAATYGGNSGCPVFNMKGEVVGVLVGGYGDYENISYVIPVDVFAGDIEHIERMFVESQYEVEEKPEEVVEQWQQY